MDVLTFLTVIKGIEYTVTVIKIGVRWYTYANISQKIGYYEDGKLIYETIKYQTHKKNKSTLYMGQFYKKLLGCAKDLTILKLERRVAKREKEVELLQQARKEKAKREETKNEKTLFEAGYLKDKLSAHYIRCDELLLEIHKALCLRKPASKQVYDRLILNVDLDDLDEHEFDEIKRDLIYVRVLDRVTGEAFISCMLKEPVYAPESILWLQAKNKKLYKVDTKTIEHENPIAIAPQ
tara:strand:- start:1368 stop:2078 length:711 start_codon:yes stop_codon:yes gene_type:complete